MKKTLFSAILICGLCGFAGAQTPDASLKKTVKFRGAALVQKENSGNDRQFIAEYIPKSESFEDFTVMFAVYFYKGHGSSAATEAQNKLAEIKARKAQGDPVANAQVFVRSDTKAVIDFVISEGKIIEHNVMMFKSLKKGLAIHKYVRRIYTDGGTSAGPEVRDFFAGIKADRGPIMAELERDDLPLPRIAK